MRIELDSSAIERLIGGDTKVEIEVRQELVTAFVKKHLKGAINEKLYNSAVKQLGDEINEIARKTLNIEGLIGVAQSKTSNRLREMVDAVAGSIVQSRVKDTLDMIIKADEAYWSRRVANLVRQEIATQVAELVRDGLKEGDAADAIRKMVADGIEAGLKEILNTAVVAIKSPKTQD